MVRPGGLTVSLDISQTRLGGDSLCVSEFLEPRGRGPLPRGHRR